MSSRASSPPIVMPNGYRYYEGRQISTIQECIKYRNLGFSAKEIRAFLNSPYGESQGMLANQIREIDHRMTYLQYTKVFLERSLAEYPRYDTEHCWSIDDHGDFYFLNQNDMLAKTHERSFMKLVTQWNDWIPATRTAALIDRRDPPDRRPSWGLAMPGEFARAMGLAYESPIAYIPASRCLVVYDRRCIDDNTNAAGVVSVRQKMLAKTNEVAERYHLSVVGPSYFFVRAKVYEYDSRHTYQKILTPIL